jgi:hypothetical protein
MVLRRVTRISVVRRAMIPVTPVSRVKRLQTPVRQASAIVTVLAKPERTAAIVQTTASLAAFLEHPVETASARLETAKTAFHARPTATAYRPVSRAAAIAAGMAKE